MGRSHKKKNAYLNSNVTILSHPIILSTTPYKRCLEQILDTKNNFQITVS